MLLDAALILSSAIGSFYLWRSNRALLGRMTELESRLTALSATQDKMGEEWAAIFAGQQKAWSKHIEKVADEVTVKLSLGSRPKTTTRR